MPVSNVITAPDRHEATSKKVILVVEDEILIRIPITDHLRDAGFSVIEAADADEAIAVITSGDRVDLVFTDINMPGNLDGQSLAIWLRTYHSALPVILTSGAVLPVGDPDRKNRRFISKPYLLMDVEAQIRELLICRPSS